MTRFAALMTTLGFVLTITGSADAKAEAPPDSPRPWLEAKIERARKLATRKFKPGTKAEDKWKAEIKSVIDDILDWPLLTRKALGSQWNKRTPKEQATFAELLREMIEASYQSKLRVAATKDRSKPATVEIKWLPETVKGNKATLKARIAAKKSAAVVEFKLVRKADQWRVWDVSIDDASTVRTYRSQFKKLIIQEGFDALVERMRKKTADIRAGRAGIAQTKTSP